jgi:hypothetical protein
LLIKLKERVVCGVCDADGRRAILQLLCGEQLLADSEGRRQQVQDVRRHEHCVQQVNLHEEHNFVEDDCGYEGRVQRKLLVDVVLVWTGEKHFGKNEEIPGEL